METKWILEIEADANNQDAYLIRLGVKSKESNHLVDLITPCRSSEEFQKEIARLQKELNQLPQEAQKRMEALNLKGTTHEKLEPEKAWKKMEDLATEAEMIQFFNSFSEEQRQLIAEYVFSHVNMFKGRGPVFSEHYDSASHLLG